MRLEPSVHPPDRGGHAGARRRRHRCGGRDERWGQPPGRPSTRGRPATRAPLRRGDRAAHRPPRSSGASLTRPALSVKIEKRPPARPQVGIDQADVGLTKRGRRRQQQCCLRAISLSFSPTHRPFAPDPIAAPCGPRRGRVLDLHRHRPGSARRARSGRPVSARSPRPRVVLAWPVVPALLEASCGCPHRSRGHHTDAYAGEPPA